MTSAPNFLDFDFIGGVSPSFPFFISRNIVSTPYPAHRHDFMEISLVVNGSGTEVINGSPHRMEPGTMTFLLPYQTHEILPEPGQELILYNCMFSLDLLLTTSYGNSSEEHLLKHLILHMETENRSYLQLGPSHRAHFLLTMERMLEELSAPSPWSQLLIRSMLAETLARFDRIRNGTSQVIKMNETPVTRKSSLIWQIVLHVHQHHQDENLTLSSVARQYQINDSYLYELFQAHIGKTFLQLLHEIRIRHACAMLFSTNLPVLDIAYRVGFNSTKTFYRVFRQLKAQSPQEYRRGRLTKPLHT